MAETPAFRSIKTAVLIVCFPCLAFLTPPVEAQDLGPNFRKIKEGQHPAAAAGFGRESRSIGKTGRFEQETRKRRRDSFMP